MSELAASYYAALAEAHQFNPAQLPEILDGKPVALLDEGVKLPVWNPDDSIAGPIAKSYRDIINSCAGLLVACASLEDMFEEDERQQRRVRQGTERHINSVVPSMLVPGKLATGYRTDVRIQAITPDDVSLNSLRSTLTIPNKTRADIDAAIAQSTLFVTAANIHPKSVSHPGYVAFLSIFRAVRGPAIACSGRQFSMGELKLQNDKWRP